MIIKQKKVVVITGASSGIGQATANMFLKNGWVVYGMSRSKAENDFKQLVCDVTSSMAVEECLKYIFDSEGQIDVFVNNAGMGISGAVEYIEKEKTQKLFDVNLQAVFDCSRQVIPYLKQSGGGKIINLSSIAAVVPIPFQTAYSASKAAINAFTMALRLEVEPFNIKVCAVMPGDTKTNFTKSRDKIEVNNDYGKRILNSVSKMEKDENSGVGPDNVAKVIFKQANKKKPSPLKSVGFSYKAIALLVKILPSRFMLWFVKKMYA
jgi:short-subunit dehydrogenase